MSGTIVTPRSFKIFSPSSVVGPFAPSTIRLVLINGAVCALMVFSIAHGANTSTSSPQNASALISDAPGNPWMLPRLSDLNFINASISRPFSLYRITFHSAMATIFAPMSWEHFAVKLPTLPNPWIAILAPRMSLFCVFKASAIMMEIPRPVALVRPKLPASSTGLPVNVPNDASPDNLIYSSIIHAMIWPLVLTSGAGTSFFSPKIG